MGRTRSAAASRSIATTAPRPFLKWAGGKTQLLPALAGRTPETFNTYFEPFLGGGALFFATSPAPATVGDLNSELVNVYKAVRDAPEALLDELKTLEPRKREEEFFLAMRRKDPAELSSIERAARMIFLNKTCYNGLWRVNSKGQFNVPFGDYTNPVLADPENIRACSAALEKARIVLGDYKKTLERAGAGDFVYLDPPYYPLTETSDFTGYTKETFGPQEQASLAKTFGELDRRKCKVLLSNSDHPEIRVLYRDYNIFKVSARRAINSKGGSRGPITELLITNY